MSEKKICPMMSIGVVAQPGGACMGFLFGGENTEMRLAPCVAHKCALWEGDHCGLRRI